MENKDGSLYFAAGIDRSKWKADLDKMRAEILGIEKTANNTDINFGITKENIAIQKQVIADIKAQMKEIEKAASDMAPGLSQATVLGELKPLIAELDAEEKALVELQGALSKTQAKYNSLTTERNKALDTMRRLTLEGKDQSDEYRVAEKSMLDYTRAIDQTNAQAKMLSAGGLANVVQGLGLISGVMATGHSIMGLFASDNENLNRIMMKTQALLAVTVTLQQLHNTVTNEGIFGVTSLTTAKNAWAAVNTRVALSLGITTAAAQVLIGTLTLGLSVAIGALIVAWDRLSEKQSKVAELNKKVADSVAEPLIAYRQLQDQWKTLGGDLKAQEKFINGNQEAFRDLGIEVKSVNDVENALIRQTSAVTESLMLRAKAAAKAEVAQEAYKKALQARMDYESESKIMKDGSFGERGVVAAKMNLRGESLIETQNKNNAIFNRMMNESAADAAAAVQKLKNSSITPWIGNPNKTPAGTKPKNSEEIAEEILPAGSVAEIQKRMAAIDEALSKSTNAGQIEALKAKRIAAAAELAEAIKKIEIKSLEERANVQAKYNTAYAVIAELQGKEAADKMYGPLMEGAQSYYGWLTNEQDKLLQKGGLLSDEDKENLAFLTAKINEIDGKKNAFQNFTDGIDDALDKIPTLAGQIEFLQNKADEQLEKKGNKSFDNGEQKYLTEQQEKLLEQQKANYEAFLKEHQSFEERKKAITDKYDDLRKSATTDSDRSLIDKAQTDELSKLALEIFKGSADWQMAFSDMEYVSQSALKRIEEGLMEFKRVKADTLQPTELRELEEALKRVRDAQSTNPFTALIGSMKSLTEAKDEVYFATERYNAAVRVSGKESDEAARASKDLADADMKQAEAKRELVGNIQKAQNIFNAVGDGLMDLGDMFGGFDDATNDAIGNIMAIGNAALDLGKSIASGDVAGMIKAGIQLISSIGKALNGDQKKERKIKQQAAVVKELEAAYNSLSRAIDQAMGDKYFDTSKQAIDNLKQQKAAIEGMMKTEQSKKKADKGKIDGYKEQIQSINNTIEDLYKSMADKVLNGMDAKSLADKLSDALTTAFENGEDAALAMGATVDDILKDMVKNALKMKILEPAMQGVVDKMLQSMGYTSGPNGMTGTFDGLTPAERDEIKNLIGAASSNYINALGAYSDLFGGIAEQSEGMKGDIKGITEKTAGALEAQINNIRIYQAEANNIHKANQQVFIQSLQNLVQIEYNTRNLIQMRQDLSELNAKTKKGLAGIL